MATPGSSSEGGKHSNTVGEVDYLGANNPNFTKNEEGGTGTKDEPKRDLLLQAAAAAMRGDTRKDVVQGETERDKQEITSMMAASRSSEALHLPPSGSEKREASVAGRRNNGEAPKIRLDRKRFQEKRRRKDFREALDSLLQAISNNDEGFACEYKRREMKMACRLTYRTPLNEDNPIFNRVELVTHANVLIERLALEGKERKRELEALGGTYEIGRSGNGTTVVFHQGVGPLALHEVPPGIPIKQKRTPERAGNNADDATTRRGSSNKYTKDPQHGSQRGGSSFRHHLGSHIPGVSILHGRHAAAGMPLTPNASLLEQTPSMGESLDIAAVDRQQQYIMQQLLLQQRREHMLTLLKHQQHAHLCAIGSTQAHEQQAYQHFFGIGDLQNLRASRHYAVPGFYPAGISAQPEAVHMQSDCTDGASQRTEEFALLARTLGKGSASPHDQQL